MKRRQAAQRREAAGRDRRAGRGRAAAIACLAVVVAAVASFVAWDLYEHRSVEVTLNGRRASVTHGTTLRQLFDEGRLEARPGDLYSISGALVGEGQGGAADVRVDGHAVAPGGLAGVVLVGGESVVARDGEDQTEPSHAETVEVAPQLRFDLADGVSPSSTTFQTGLLEYVEQWGQAGRSVYLVGDVSGERVEQEVLSERVDCVVRCQGIHPDGDEKLVALTFDDGPSAYTARYLDILEEKGAKATFMVIGCQVAARPGVLADAVAAGNQLGSHTWDHKDMSALAADELRGELADTIGAVRDATGVSPTLVRPPYGNLTSQSWLGSAGLMSSCVVWTHDSADWKLPGADAIVESCTSWMRPGCVILMHDGGGNRDEDLEALPRVIDAWQKEGYRFVTMAELLASDSSVPREVATGTQAMPEGAAWPDELADDPYAAS